VFWGKNILMWYKGEKRLKFFKENFLLMFWLFWVEMKNERGKGLARLLFINTNIYSVVAWVWEENRHPSYIF
jgi:hypothetical protein